MMPRIRRSFALLVLACLIVYTMGLKSDTIKTQPAKPTQLAAWQLGPGLIEVHIRRLHLVRPDLIPYPIAYEVVC